MSPRTPITSEQRFIGDHRCPICGGAADDPHGEGVRCYGYLSSNGHYAHCTRENHASRLPLSRADTYAHRLSGDCRCGRPHDPAVVRQRDRIRAGMERERAQPTDLTRFEVRALDGTVAAIKVREDYSDGVTKTFWWEQPNGTKGLGDRAVTSLPLYGTERLANAEPDALVILCEGEKKTHALTSRGVLALGTGTGASAIPDDDVLRSLLGHSVILWPDNDRGGHRHMRRIAERLKALGHTDVKLLPWPDAPLKGDAADFFELGGTVESLNDLIAQAAPLAEHGTPATSSAAATRTVTPPPSGTLVDIHQRTSERERQHRRIMLTNYSPEDVEAWQQQREQEQRAEEEAAQRAEQLRQIEALLQTHIEAGDPHALLSTLRESTLALSIEERRPYVEPFIAMIAGLAQTDQDVLVAQAARVFLVGAPTLRQQIAALGGPEQQAASLVQDPQPWEEEVNGANLLDTMAAEFTRFLVLPDHAADALALWCLFSHSIAAFDIAPILSLQSPTKRCGKTRALDVIQMFARRPVIVANVTSAALFRVNDLYHPTLIADEGDTFMGGDKTELRGVYNSSWSRHAAWVLRNIGDSHHPTMFSTWGPKVIALIGALQDTMQDRSIAIHMRRRLKHEPIAKLRRPARQELRELQLDRKALRWANDHVDALSEADPAIPEAIQDDDRASENWGTLFAIADEVGGDWPERARAAAVVLSGGERRVEDHSDRIELLRDLHALAKGQEQDRVFTKEIIRWLTMNPGTWSLYNHGKGITETQLAGLLEGFEIKPRTVRIGASTAKGYVWSEFTEVFSRYLSAEPLSEPSQPSQVNKDNKLDPKNDPSQPSSVTASKPELTTGKDKRVTGVTAEKGGSSTQRAPRTPVDPPVKRTPVPVTLQTKRPKRTPVH